MHLILELLILITVRSQKARNVSRLGHAENLTRAIGRVSYLLTTKPLRQLSELSTLTRKNMNLCATKYL